MANNSQNKSSFKFLRTTFARQFSVPVVTQSVCPICFIDASKKKIFYCAQCALKKASPAAGGSVEQLMDSLNALRIKKMNLMESFNSVVSIRDAEMKRRIEKLRCEIHKLRTDVSRMRSGNKEKAKKLTSLRSTVRDYRIYGLKHDEKYSKAAENIRNLEGKLVDCITHMSRAQSDLASVQWRIMLDLFQNVVPLSRIESAPSVEAVAVGFNEEPDKENLVAFQLAEAQRWAYMNGRWIEANPTIVTPTSGYRILTALVPPDGSCSAYVPFAVDSVGQGVTVASTDTSLCSQGPGGLLSKDLVVGFSYMNQLVTSLASVFHIFLPFPLSIFHKDVLCGRLSVEQFRIYAARVSANICFLCLMIGLDGSVLRPCNPAYNLWLLFEFVLNRTDSDSKPEPLNIIRSLSLDTESELQRILDNPNADAVLTNVATPLCASTVDPSYFECMADDDEWVMTGGMENYADNVHNVDPSRGVSTASFMTSTNPLLPSTITSAFFSFLRGNRSSSQS